ncbi:HIV Tat-specific factor 1 homolog [Triticum aestivum]|uniref:HIV Tat-specific factor 1 homolog n=1 Tax=Triticum aestivum TaxID=4565 RepID=UPI001D005B96|nr:HIV Tat-specific factor 1 homolog [Triticum aestivum]
MASTEEQVFLGSRNLSYHSAHYPDASADWDYPEDPGDRREGVEVAELHDQPARMSTSYSDPCEVARRALDLMFPREEDSDDCWGTWSAREEGTDDDDEQGGEGVDDCSTQEGSDYEDDDRNCQVILAETNCPGKLYPKSEADEIDDKWVHRYSQQLSEHEKLCREIMALRGDDDDDEEEEEKDDDALLAPSVP